MSDGNFAARRCRNRRRRRSGTQRSGHRLALRFVPAPPRSGDGPGHRALSRLHQLSAPDDPVRPAFFAGRIQRVRAAAAAARFTRQAHAGSRRTTDGRAERMRRASDPAVQRTGNAGERPGAVGRGNDRRMGGTNAGRRPRYRRAPSSRSCASGRCSNPHSPARSSICRISSCGGIRASRNMPSPRTPIRASPLMRGGVPAVRHERARSRAGGTAASRVQRPGAQ